MREHNRYHFKGIPGTYPADPPGVETVCYEFDTEAEMNESGLLHDKRRTSCCTSNGKFYVAGHFTETQTYQNGLSKQGRDEVMTYFFERYERAGFRVVPGHWPDFKTKEEVDEYIDATEKIMEAFRK